MNDERLSAYLDDELSREERAQIESLLEQREDYRTALEELRSVRAALKSLTGFAAPVDSQAPDGFAERVRAEVQATASSVATGANGESGQDKSGQNESGSAESGNGSTIHVTPARKKGGFQSYIGPLAALAALILALLTVPSILHSNRNVAKNASLKSEAAASVDRDEVEEQLSRNEIEQPDEKDQGSLGLEGMDTETDAYQSAETSKRSFGEGTQSEFADDDRSSTFRRLQGRSMREESRTDSGPASPVAEPRARKVTAAPAMEPPAIAADEEAFDDSADSGVAKGEFKSFNLSREPAAAMEAMGGAGLDNESDELASGNFLFGCDAVCEVNLSSKEQAGQFVRTLLSNNVQMNESSWLAASADKLKEQTPGRSGEAAGEKDGEEEPLWKLESKNETTQSDVSDTLAWAAKDDEGTQALVLDVAAADVGKIVEKLKEQSIEFSILTVADQKGSPASSKWSNNPQQSYGGFAEGQAIGGADIAADGAADGTADGMADGMAVEEGVSAASGAFGGGVLNEGNRGVANRVQLSSQQTTNLNRLKEIHKSSRGVTANRFGQNFYYRDYGDNVDSELDREGSTGKSERQNGDSKASNASRGADRQSGSRLDAGKESAAALRQTQTAALQQLIDITRQQQPKLPTQSEPQCRILITVNPPESAAEK